MGIKTTVIKEVSCDKCKLQIDNGDVWVDWGERGIIFHWSCLTTMTTVEFIEFALERGDQMFVKIDTDEMRGVELKHIWAGAVNAVGPRNSVLEYRRKYAADYD